MKDLPLATQKITLNLIKTLEAFDKLKIDGDTYIDWPSVEKYIKRNLPEDIESYVQAQRVEARKEGAVRFWELYAPFIPKILNGEMTYKDIDEKVKEIAAEFQALNTEGDEV